MSPDRCVLRAGLGLAVLAISLFLPVRRSEPADGFRRGDSNGDSVVDIGDVLDELFHLYVDGEQPGCLDAADANDSGSVGMDDAISTLGYLFLNAVAPPPFGPTDRGEDPTLDGLDCAPQPPCKELLELGRLWEITRTLAITRDIEVLSERDQALGPKIGEILDESFGLGAFLLAPPERADLARSEVFSNESGETYWLRAESPHALLREPGGTVGSRVRLKQVHRFRKRAADATLQFVVSGLVLELIDSDQPHPPDAAECPWAIRSELRGVPGAQKRVCFVDKSRLANCDPLDVSVRFESFMVAGVVRGGETVSITHGTDGYASLSGYRSKWDPFIDEDPAEFSSDAPTWIPSDFDVDLKLGQDGSHARPSLTSPPVIDVPLEKLPLEQEFELRFEVGVEALNHRQGESYASAYFRDPLGSDGLAIGYSGLDPLPAEEEPPPAQTEQPGAVCAALGERAPAVLTIVDDDNLPKLEAPRSYRVGGTVTGLLSSGLVLEDRSNFIAVPVGNNPFVFNYTYDLGDTYDVRVATQPSSPVQICAVACGAGTVSADVTDIAIDCAAPPPPLSGLDPSFGIGGVATDGPSGNIVAMALQADGKLVAAIGNTLVRYQANGAHDPSFGAGGSVA